MRNSTNVFKKINHIKINQETINQRLKTEFIQKKTQTHKNCSIITKTELECFDDIDY